MKVFCQECYEKGSDHCPSCGRAVDGHSVRVNGSSFHSDCFVCCVCKKKMVNIPFVADDKNQVLLKSVTKKSIRNRNDIRKQECVIVMTHHEA